MRFLALIAALALTVGCGRPASEPPVQLTHIPVFVTGPPIDRAELAMALREAEEKMRVEKGWYDQVPSR